MKTSSALIARVSRAAYTLVELLVVIVIIAVLAGFLVPQAITILKDSVNLKTTTLMVSLKNGIGSFQTDYGRFPLEKAPPSGEDTELLTDGSTTLIDALMGLPAEGEETSLNPKGTKFSEFQMAKNDRDGVLHERPRALHDYWGNPLRVLLDTNGDHQVKNPDALNADPKIAQPGGKPVSEFLPMEVAIYSVGKDGVAHTADDLVSWR